MTQQSCDVRKGSIAAVLGQMPDFRFSDNNRPVPLPLKSENLFDSTVGRSFIGSKSPLPGGFQHVRKRNLWPPCRNYAKKIIDSYSNKNSCFLFDMHARFEPCASGRISPSNPVARSRMLSDILAIAFCIAAAVVSIGLILVIVDRSGPAFEPIRNLKIVSSAAKKDFEATGLKNADRLQQNSDFQMAGAVSKRLVAAEFIPELIGFGAVTMAYAPAAAEINSPFDELLGGDADQFDTHATLPRLRPEKILIGHGPLRRRPNDHKWAANMLPAHVYEAKQQDCLARGIYFEARGEPERGQVAIGQVIINRVKNPAYPSKICDVVYQNFEQRNACQFSFACDGIEDRIRSTKHYKIAQEIAREVTDGTIFLYEVGDSTHFHTTSVRPKWAGELTKTKRIGQHIFYRTKKGGWS